MARDTLTPYFTPQDRTGDRDRPPVTVCQPAREGGMCGCDEPDYTPPAPCLSSECSC